MKSKLIVSVSLFLLANICISCSNDPAPNYNTERNSIYPNNWSVRENTTTTNSIRNVNELTSLKDANSEEYFRNIANKEKIKPDNSIPINPRYANVANVQNEINKIKDKEKVLGIEVREKEDKTKIVVVLLKSGIGCEFPIEMMPKGKETPDEEVIKIVEKNKNSKMCENFGKK